MDGRHEYLLSTVAERLDMSVEDAEEFMLDEDQVMGECKARMQSLQTYNYPLPLPPNHCQLKEFDSFFSPGGRAALLFFYQQAHEEGKPGWSMPNCVYFTL